MSPPSPINDAGEDENAIPLVQSKTDNSHDDSEDDNMNPVATSESNKSNKAEPNGKGGLVASTRNAKSPPPSRRSRGSSPALGTLRKWWGELSCCMLVLAALFAITATLYPYRGRPLPRWPYGLSINTLLSIYVLILKAAMLYLISQGMPRTKRPHPSL